MKPPTNIVDRFCWFVNDREQIRLKKEAGATAPWTEDATLAKYRFTNVRRMDDRVSRWLMDNWYTLYRGHHNMLYAVGLARFFNNPQTLQQITHHVFKLGVPDWETIRKTIRGIQKLGLVVFNAAYMVRGNDGVDKVGSVVNQNVKPLGAIQLVPNSMEKTHTNLVQSYGIGSFMGGQIVADLRWAMEGDWEDKNQWAPMGPGSARGLARIMYGAEWKDKAKRMKQEEFLTGLLLLREESWKRLPASLCERLEMMDWQNTLCEFDKWSRVYGGEGKPKQLYRVAA